MPTISRFRGIKIQMFKREHGPPHFHAIYAGEAASYAVANLTVLRGRLPRRVDRLVRRWAHEHHEELLLNWWMLQSGQPPKAIEPLK